MARKVRWQPEARWQSKLHAEDDTRAGDARDELEQLHADAEAAHADAPDASRFIESTKLADVIADALCDAPTDCFKDFLNNIILVGGFAGGTHGVSWGGRPPQGVPSPPEWEFEDDEAGSPLPRHLPGSWLKDALQSAVDEALKARGHQVPQNHWGRGAKVVCPSTAPQEAGGWVDCGIADDSAPGAEAPHAHMAAPAEGRRLWVDRRCGLHLRSRHSRGHVAAIALGQGTLAGGPCRSARDARGGSAPRRVRGLDRAAPPERADLADRGRCRRRHSRSRRAPWTPAPRRVAAARARLVGGARCRATGAC